MFASNTSAANGAATYIEDVFSTYLYTGNGSTQTITNGIDLAGKGGLVWIKSRSIAGTNHWLIDSARGFNTDVQSPVNRLETNTTSGQLLAFTNNPTYKFVPSSTGFNFSYDNTDPVNTTNATYASWTFRKQPKFFDVVTYTGSGASGKVVNHSLGSVPGCIIIKRTDGTGDAWCVWHRGIHSATNETSRLILNTTAANTSFGGTWLTSVTSTAITFAAGFSNFNASGATYVAYLFAHDAGGFGLTGTDNVISCGSYTGTGVDNNTITLGYEPQLVIIKRATGGTGAWNMSDTMRGMIASPSGTTAVYGSVLQANDSGAENSSLGGPYYQTYVTPTGFTLGTSGPETNAANSTYIYIAIRRGPMKTPTSGTSVLGLRARTGTGANATVTNGFADLAIIKNRGSAVDWLWSSRLTSTGYLSSNATTAETAAGTTILQANSWDVMDGIKVGTTSTLTNASSNTFINYLIKRAPGFFDEVCYTGTGSARTVNHNLTVAPEMMIVKKRNSATNSNWVVYCGNLLTPITNNAARNFLLLNTTQAGTQSDVHWNQTAPTASVFTVGASTNTNSSADTFVAYLFASCPGVSKVGSYVGNGTNQIINCGFVSSARFILIKGVDVEARDWYLWDSARGIVVGNDSILNPNTNSAQTTGFDDVEAYSTGFKVLQGGAQVNTSGYNYIFLAIA